MFDNQDQSGSAGPVNTSSEPQLGAFGPQQPVIGSIHTDHHTPSVGVTPDPVIAPVVAPMPTPAPTIPPAAPTDEADKKDDDLLDNKDTDGLLAIKQTALQQLSPLVGHLEQSPEEEFRTTMMLIQASDDKSLISKAYEAAGKIKDEKERAQALLDVINEINYFTQQQQID